MIPLQDYFKKVEAVFGRNGDKLLKMKLKEYDQQMALLQDGMKTGLKKCEGAGLLKDYSPWLQSFQSTNYQFAIEIPGELICIVSPTHLLPLQANILATVDLYRSIM